MKAKWKYFLLAFLCTGLVQCGKKAEDEVASKVDIVMPNKSPLVRVTPRNLGTTEISDNWFDSVFMVRNNSGKDVRIEEVMFYVTIDGVETGPHIFDLGVLTLYDEDGGSPYIFMDYCTYPKNMAGAVKMAACSNGTADPEAGVPYSFPLTFYIGRLPKPQIPSLLAFPVRVEFHGVVLDGAGGDADRFFKTINFTTR
ncbi:MAG: hypothetical protein KF789_06180 [Bdellovibrionaceae bacterium]|nr:hypothetical protein [Pseudobdellovibrionaceae bacterium]